MEAYSQTMVNESIGLWLERILHVSNQTKGDSPKIAGCLDLLRVQGRWAASARLAWVRCILTSAVEVTGGVPLSKSAPNKFPGDKFWSTWESFLEQQWVQHANNIVKPSGTEKPQYWIDHAAEKLFVNCLKTELFSRSSMPDRQFEDSFLANLSESRPVHKLTCYHLGAADWTDSQALSFLRTAVRGFLRGDLYTALSELLSRAEGSFGLQAHCTLEPGVVVIASKGQPMSISYNPSKPLCLFASEAEALAVPVDTAGTWLTDRIDLDSHGEVMRLGPPRPLQEGAFAARSNSPTGELSQLESLLRESNIFNQRLWKLRQPGETVEASMTRLSASRGLELPCGIELRAYSLVTHCEASAGNLIERSVAILAAPIPYDPTVDLVAADLAVTPAVLSTIDRGT